MLILSRWREKEENLFLFWLQSYRRFHHKSWANLVHEVFVVNLDLTVASRRVLDLVAMKGQLVLGVGISHSCTILVSGAVVAGRHGPASFLVVFFVFIFGIRIDFIASDPREEALFKSSKKSICKSINILLLLSCILPLHSKNLGNSCWRFNFWVVRSGFCNARIDFCCFNCVQIWKYKMKYLWLVFSFSLELPTSGLVNFW